MNWGDHDCYWKLISIDTPYKKLLKDDMISEYSLKNIRIQPNDDSVLDDQEILSRLVPLEKRDHPLEIYLLNHREELLSSIRFFPAG